VYKKPDAKESDPLSMATNLAKKMGANSLLTTAIENIGSMSHENQKMLLDMLGTGLNTGYKFARSLVGGAATKTDAQLVEDAKVAEKARLSGQNATPVVDLAAPIPEPTKPPVIPTDTIPEKEKPKDGLPDVTNSVVPSRTFEPFKPSGSLGQPQGMLGDSVWYSDKPSYAGTNSNAQGAPSGYFAIGYQPPPAPVAPALGVPGTNSSQVDMSGKNSYETPVGTPNPYTDQSNYLTNEQVETLTPAEIEQLKQSSVLPTRYPTPISQPTSAAPTPAAQPVDNSEVSNYDYMKSVVLTAIAASAAAFQSFLFDNPLLRDTVQQAVVQGAKTIGDVLPYLRQYINGMPREKIYQRFRSNV
jgi:hypothetical protein